MKQQQMSIIQNEEQQSSKYYLLKQSLNEDLNMRMNRNQSFTNSNTKKKNYFYSKNINHKNIEDEISEWRTEVQVNLIEKHRKLSKFLLPEVNNKSKSHNLQQLTRELLKYQQFDIQNMNQNNKFRLTLLKHMTKINFKNQKKNKSEKESKSPKKINLKLKFPDRYEKLRQQNYDIHENYQSGQNNHDMGVDCSYKLSPLNQDQDMKSSFYAQQRSSRGLIPSIKKLVSSSFMKKSMFRSDSQYEPYTSRRLNFLRSSFNDSQNNFIEEIREKFDQKEKIIEETTKRVKLAKIERKVPVNFLSYSNRKNKNMNKIQQSLQKDNNNKQKKSQKNILNGSINIIFNNNHLKSFYPKLKTNDKEIDLQQLNYSHKRLSQCLLLNNKILPHNHKFIS